MPGRAKTKWVKDKDERLIQDYNDGLSYKALAEKRGLTVAAIRNRLYELRKQGLVDKRGRGL